jgi:hypothetical protein
MNATTPHNTITTHTAGVPPAPSEAHQKPEWVQIDKSELDRHFLSGEFFISRRALDDLSSAGTTMFDLLSWFNAYQDSVCVGDTRQMSSTLQAYFGFDSSKPNRLCFFVQIDRISKDIETLNADSYQEIFR